MAVRARGQERARRVESRRPVSQGTVNGADSIDDIAGVRHGGMKKTFPALTPIRGVVVPARSFTLGHVCQLDAITSGGNLTPDGGSTSSPGGLVWGDVMVPGVWLFL